jgi:glutathione S-transferase
MKIVGSLTSPFVRLTRVVCAELGIEYELEVTQFFAKQTPQQAALVLSHNPLDKVPILVDGDWQVIDSRIIVKYLLKHGTVVGDFRADFPRDADEDNVLTIILGALDAGVLRFVMKATHPEIKLEEGYMARCKDKIEQGLTWLDKRKDLGASFGVTEAALICALEWFEKRNIYPWREFPNIVRLHAAYRDRPSLVATRIPESA